MILIDGKKIAAELREELKTVLAEMTYDKLIETDKAMSENAKEIIADVPLKIFVG